jgi:hypothetical protein
METSDNISKKLTEAGQELPFTVPHRYFDDFPARLQARLDQETHKSTVVSHMRWIDYLKPAMGLAAAFAAVFLLVYWPAKLITNQESLSAKSSVNGYDENLINLVEHVDDNTFFSLLEGTSSNVKLNADELENYIASNYSEYDIYLETQKK